MSLYSIGEVHGSNKALLIVDKIKKGRRPYYKVQCQICKNDVELHGDAIFDIPSDYFKNGKLPCGCSNNKKWSKSQWTIIIKRKAISNNHTLLEFVASDKFDQNTKCKLSCNTCGNIWESCSINNYIRDRTCPVCADTSRAMKKVTRDSIWLDRFRATGLFSEDIFSFERVSETGRLWKVRCQVCGDKEFISDRSNLVAGKIPCDCGIGGGYDVTKLGYFYILEVNALGHNFIKFGISNFPKRRLVSHNRVLREIGGNVLSKTIFQGNGKLVLAIESELKRTLDIENKFIDGFRKEACSLDCKDTILKAVQSLELVTQYLKI